MNRTKLAKNDQKELNAIFQLATESKAAKDTTNRVTQILDAHYEKANIVETISKCTGEVFISPKVPSNNSSYFFSRLIILFCFFF